MNKILTIHEISGKPRDGFDQNQIHVPLQGILHQFLKTWPIVRLQGTFFIRINSGKHPAVLA
jgi:hypothetical protein